MAQATYQIRLKNTAGALVALFTQENILGLRITKSVNDVHTHELTLDATAETRVDLFELDGQIEVWRRPPCWDWYLEYEGFHRDAEWQTDDDGREIFVSRGVGYQDILARRIIAAYAGSSEAAKSDAAETVVKEFVDEQMGSAGREPFTGLSIEADGAGGNSISISRPYRNLLEVCQEIAAIGGGDFDVVGIGAALFEFRWYDGQRGDDHTVATGTEPVIFSTAFGNMLRPRLVKQSARATAVLVAGGGEGEARAWEWRPASLPSNWQLREVFRDARDTDDTDTMQARGDAELNAGRAVSELQFDVLQTSSSVYGVHYALGDLVTARYRDAEYNLKITRVMLNFDEAEDISLEFEDV